MTRLAFPDVGTGGALGCLVLMAWGCAPILPGGARRSGDAGRSWETLAPLPIAVRAAAAAVGDGVIYVVGGEAPGGMTDLLQIFDLESGRWSVGESLPRPSAWGGAVWFGDRLHFLGGVTDQVAASQQHWIYDPAEDTWSRGRPLPLPAAAGVVAARDSRIYVLGGIDSPQRASGNVLIFDRGPDRWSVGRAVPGTRSGWAGALLDGRILAVGGSTWPRDQDTRDLLVYDPDKDAWGTLDVLDRWRESHGAAAVGHRLCVVGGKRPGVHDPVLLADGACWDDQRGTWTSLPDLPHPRHEIAVVSVGDDLYVLGGRDAESHPVSDALRLRVR